MPVGDDERDARVGDHAHVADREVAAQQLVLARVVDQQWFAARDCVLLLVILLVAYYAGGYVAGRTSRQATARPNMSMG